MLKEEDRIKFVQFIFFTLLLFEPVMFKKYTFKLVSLAFIY